MGYSALNDTVAIFICRRPSNYLRQFCAEINDIGLPLDIVIISDEPTECAGSRAPEIFIPDVECLAMGFRGSTNFDRAVTGWDRALFFAEKTSYKKLWFIEDDVCFRNIRAFGIFMTKYLAEDSDLLCCSFARYSRESDWDQWHTAEGFFSIRVTAGAFEPLCRLSRTVIDRVGELAMAHKKLCFHETMFSSICAGLRLSVNVFDQNEAMIVWKPISMSTQEVSELFQRNFLVVHPYKEIVDQDSYRSVGARLG